MGKICYHRTTGMVNAWVRTGELPPYNATTHTEIESDTPPPDGMVWTGSGWVPIPPKTNAEKDEELQAHLESVAGRINKVFATILIQKGICTLAEIRQGYRNIT